MRKGWGKCNCLVEHLQEFLPVLFKEEDTPHRKTHTETQRHTNAPHLALEQLLDDNEELLEVPLPGRQL